MRILIYSETEEAKAKQAALRAEGHHASLRNPHYFDPAQMDKACDLAIVDDAAIFDAYAAAGIKVERLTVEETQPQEVIVETAPETADAPKPKRARKGNGTDE